MIYVGVGPYCEYFSAFANIAKSYLSANFFLFFLFRIIFLPSLSLFYLVVIAIMMYIPFFPTSSVKHAPALLLVFASLLLSACSASHQSAASSDNPLKRKPITEVSEHQLARESRLIEAKMQAEAGNVAEARHRFYSLSSGPDECSAAHYELGQLMLQDGQLDSALFHVQRAAQLEPSNIWYYLLLADIYEELDDAERSIATWEHIVSLQPDKIEYYYQLSNAYLLDDDITHAIEVLNRVEKKYGITETISLQKEKLWSAMGMNDKALAEIEALAKTMPDNTKYSAILAEHFMRNKDYKRAKPFYDDILSAHPDDEYIHISLANYYKLTGDPSRAFNELLTGFANPNLDCDSKLQILSSFYSDDEFYNTYAPTSFLLLDTLRIQCADNERFTLFYGDVLMRRGNYAGAFDCFQNYLVVDSSQYELWEAILICGTMSSANDTLMLSYAQRCSRLFPLHILPLFVQASIAYERDDYNEALRHLNRCMKIGFRKGYLEADAYSLAAMCHYQLGNIELSWNFFDQCLRVTPDDLTVLNNYAYFLSEHKVRLNDAERMSKRTIVAEPDNPTFLDTYAWILHQMGRDREALSFIRRALDNSPSASDTLQQHFKIISDAQ